MRGLVKRFSFTRGFVYAAMVPGSTDVLSTEHANDYFLNIFPELNSAMVTEKHARTTLTLNVLQSLVTSAL